MSAANPIPIRRNLAAAHAEQSVARIALLEQDFARRHLLGMAEAGNPLQFVGPEVRKHRIHLQDDRKFGLFTHRDAFSVRPLGREAVAWFGCNEVCHKSHNIAVPPDYFCLL